MLAPPTTPYSLSDLIRLHPKRAFFWPMPESVPVPVEFTVGQHTIDLTGPEGSGWVGTMSVRSRAGSYSLYPIEDLEVLTAWLTEHREAYARQVKTQEWERHQAAHPSWERTVVYPTEISDELRAEVRKTEASGQPLSQWRPHVGAARRVLAVDGIRLFGIPLYDPDTYQPLLCRSAVVRTLNKHRVVAMTAAACNRCPDIFDLFPGSGGWVFLTRAEAATVETPTLLYTRHDGKTLAYVRLWHLDHTPCEGEIGGFEYIEGNAYHPHDWGVLELPWLYEADHDSSTGGLRP